MLIPEVCGQTVHRRYYFNSSKVIRNNFCCFSPVYLLIYFLLDDVRYDWNVTSICVVT